MANLKNITELPLAESADGLNLIVNDNGAAKQIAAHEVGAQADWAEMDETSPAFIKNKPIEEWDLDITVNMSVNPDGGGFIFEPVINSGTFDIVKNKILNNEQPKIKSHIVFTLPVDTSKISHESSVIYAVGYMPEGFGDDFPEEVGLLGQSIFADTFLFYSLYPDNTIVVNVH